MGLKLHALIRSFNSRMVIDTINRLSLVKPPLESVIVAVDVKRDEINTPQVLSEIDSPFPIRVVLLELYGWSKALNAAINGLPLAGDEIAEFIMPISNEVMIEPEHIQMLLDLACQKNASCGFALFKNRYEISYRIPRNTCAIWKRNLFSKIGLFDERLDSQGGMEDYEMALRAFDRLRLLPLALNERIGLKIRDPNTFPQKVAMEKRAIEIIEERYPREVVDTVKKKLQNQIL